MELVTDSTVKKGYKQTEVGVIPEDWEVNELEQYYSYISYGFTNPMPTTKSGIFMITAKDIQDGKLNYKTARTTSEQAYSTFLTAKSKPKKNDLLLTKDGSLGRLAIVGDTKICINQSVAVIRPNDRVDSVFLKKLLESSFYQRVMLENAGGSTIKHIYITIVNSMPIGVPRSVTEQKAIAQVLSDTDSLIQSLEKKIEKKRLVKEGVMQELMQDNEDWDITTLGDICYVRDGTHQTPNYVSDGIPFYSVENVSKNDFQNTKYISNAEHQFLTKNWKIEKGDILMTRIGSVGVCKLIDWDVDASFYVSLGLLKVKKGYSSSFIAQYSNTESFKKEIALNSLIFAIPKKINLGKISDVKISIPNNLSEQTRIATILSDMDAELEALQQKLSKYKQLKQGLMQNLLTGKIRLV